MSKTIITSADNINPKLVEERLLFLDTVKESFFGRFMSKDGNSIVHEKTDFTKRKGDTMYFPIRYRLTGSGVTGNQPLKGKEEKLQIANSSIVLERYRHAVLDDGALTRQRSPFELTPEMRRALLDWGAELIDKQMMTALTTSPTTSYYGGTASSVGTLGANDLLTPALISKVKVVAKTQRSSYAIPLNPIKIGSRECYVLLTSPDSLYDLTRNSEYTQAMREAMIRGTDNPLFKSMIESAEAIWDNVLVFSHENTPVYSNGGGAAITYTQNVLMGAQALIWAWGERPSMVEEDEDYKEFKGIAWRMTAKGAKPVFNSKDFGSISIYTADTRTSGRTIVVP